MISSRVQIKSAKGFEITFRSFFKFQGYEIETNKIAHLIATTLISRVRKNFMKQQNPDKSKWKMTKAAQKRLSGGYTYAKGGRFAPGGKKTGGNILFASGNLFHSIQLVNRGVGAYAIMTDVPYAKYYQNEKHTIIGASDQDIDQLAQTIIARMV